MRLSRLSAALLLFAISGCRVHTLDDGVYDVVPGEILRDDCGLARPGVLTSVTLRTEGNQVTMTLNEPVLRLVGTYRFSVEEMTLDGTMSNYTAMLRGRECLLDTVNFHVDTLTTSSSAFTGAMSINYDTRTPDECVCKYWFKFSAQRQ